MFKFCPHLWTVVMLDQLTALLLYFGVREKLFFYEIVNWNNIQAIS